MSEDAVSAGLRRLEADLTEAWKRSGDPTLNLAELAAFAGALRQLYDEQRRGRPAPDAHDHWSKYVK